MKRRILTGMMALLLCAPAWAAAAAFPIAAPQSGDDNKPWLGVMLQDVTKEFAKEHDLTITEGAYVSDVIEHSPADSAGIKEGDVIVEFGGKRIGTAQALVKAVSASSVGAAVPIVIMRGSERKTVTATLSRATKRVRVITRTFGVPGVTEGMPSLPPPRTFFMGCSGTYGMQLSTLNEQLGAFFGAPNGKGVLVQEVEADGKAAKAGFKAGDVIVKAGKKTVATVRDFTAAFGAYDDGEILPVEVLRKGAKQVLNLEVHAGEEGDDTLFDVGEGMLRLRCLPELDGEDMDIRVDTGDIDDAVKEFRIQVEKGRQQCDEAREQLQQQRRQIRILKRVVEPDDI